MYAATSASNAAASIRCAPSRTSSSSSDSGHGCAGVGLATTVSTDVPSRPAVARRPCLRTCTGAIGKVRPPRYSGPSRRSHRPIHRFQALLFLVAVAPKHRSGIGNTVWAVRRFFAFLNDTGLCSLRVDAMLSQIAPRRMRVLPRFTQDEIGRLLGVIDPSTAVGKRDLAIVQLAVSTGLRCGDIVGLQLRSIDWRRDEIRIVQRKTSVPLALPLAVEAGNAVVDYVLNARPVSDEPEVFLRAYAPYVG